MKHYNTFEELKARVEKMVELLNTDDETKNQKEFRTMKLFLISQDENTGYDTYDSAVVAANDENEARNMHPDGETIANTKIYYCADWATHPDNVKVEYIGKAKPGTEAGVILKSFNAG